MNMYLKETSEDISFDFGKNWSRFLTVIDENRIVEAEKSLKKMLNTDTLIDKYFLDIGCGSGIISLAARRLGAKVHSFDYDPHSVACTAELKKRYFPDDVEWKVEAGDILNIEYVKSLGQFDIVYAWGVLHHTGAMWMALENSLLLIRPSAKLFISIYNDQGRTSVYWRMVKRRYNCLPKYFRFLILYPAFIRLWGPTILRDFYMGNPYLVGVLIRKTGACLHGTMWWIGLVVILLK